MNKRVVAAIACVVIGCIIYMVVRHRGGASDDAPPITAAQPTTPAAAPRAADVKAHAIVTVRDERGPVAGAIVRLATDADEILIGRTGSDGVARADELVAGSWTISASALGHEPVALPSRTLAAGETAQLTVTLPIGGRTLVGTVVDATGGPISGARIDAAHVGPSAKRGDAVASTLTAGDGTYQLTVAEGTAIVAASSTDYAPQSRYVQIGATRATADFALVPGGVIEGVVRDEHTHELVPGAEVDASRDAPTMSLGEAARHAVTAGVDGHFRVTGLRPGAYVLGAQLGGRTSREPTRVGLGVAEQAGGVEILIGSSPVIRGIAVDEAGALQPGIEIHSFGDNATAKTDAKGAFTLEGLAPGKHALYGKHADGTAPSLGGAPAAAQARAADLVSLAPVSVQLGAKDVDGVRIVMRHGVKISGHVEPREACDVAFKADDAIASALYANVAGASTGADGAFELGPAGPGGATLVARCANGDIGERSIVVASGMSDVVIAVASSATLAGHVVDAAGKPIAGVTVIANPHGERNEATIINGIVTSGVQARVDDSGAFELTGLAAGVYRLGALDGGQPLPISGKPVEVTLAASEHKTGVVVAVDRANGVIEGTVTGADGAPIADAWVSVHQELDDMLAGMLGDPNSGESNTRVVTVDNDGGGGVGEIAPALTDASGHFKLVGLPRVPWTVVAEAGAGALRGRALKVTPDAQITIRALGVTELRGTVHGPSGPAPLFSVSLDGPTKAQQSFANADGSFSFPRVDPGAYTVHVESSIGNGDATVQVVVGQTATVDIALAENAIVIGRLVDSSGKPVVGVPVAVVPASTDGKISVSLSGPPPTSEADGSFRIEAKAGPSAFVALVQPRPVTRNNLALQAGQTFDVGAVVVDQPSPQQGPLGPSPPKPPPKPPS